MWLRALGFRDSTLGLRVQDSGLRVALRCVVSCKLQDNIGKRSQRILAGQTTGFVVGLVKLLAGGLGFRLLFCTCVLNLNFSINMRGFPEIVGLNNSPPLR